MNTHQHDRRSDFPFTKFDPKARGLIIFQLFIKLFQVMKLFSYLSPKFSVSQLRQRKAKPSLNTEPTS